MARGGLEALRKAHTRSLGLAVVDVDLASEPDGLETAEWLRRLYAVPVIAISLRHDPDLRQRLRAIGTAGYLARPFETGELVGLVASVLARRPAAEFVSTPDALRNRVLRVEGGVVTSWDGQPPGAGVQRLPGFAALSGREWQIIRDLIDTPSAHAVALKRQRSPHTVHNHLKSIFRKLEVHSIAELLSLMLRLSCQTPL